MNTVFRVGQLVVVKEDPDVFQFCGEIARFRSRCPLYGWDRHGGNQRPPWSVQGRLRAV